MVPVSVKGISIGEGMPKTIVPIMGRCGEAILSAAEDACEQAKRAFDAGADMLELRADTFDFPDDATLLAQLADAVGNAVSGCPLLFTLRSSSQGGRVDLPDEVYRSVLGRIAACGSVDLLDIELSRGDSLVSGLSQLARRAGVVPLVSHHDCSSTPASEEIIRIFQKMESLGAGVAKVAVFAQSRKDCLVLLEATDCASHAVNMPIVSVAMGAAGSLSRLVGEQFGSAMTFCSLGKASAEGQLPLPYAKRIICGLHELTDNESTLGNR